MNLNKIMEAFYKSILDYAGLTVLESGIISSGDEDGPFIKNKRGNYYHLPYFELLKHPEGKAFFHLLNENYAKPEQETFNIYRNNLTLNINIKLAYLIRTLFTIASNGALQRKIKNKELTKIFSEMGEVDDSMIEILSGPIIDKAVAEYGTGYLVGFFFKNKGKIDGETFGVVGKVNFPLYVEAKETLESGPGTYEVYGHKVRKKDAQALMNVMLALFPNCDEPELYSVGNNNKIFRYLQALLSVTYVVTSRINEVIEALSTDLVDDESVAPLISNLEWVAPMEELFGMANEIRLIPNQDDILSEVMSEADKKKQPPAKLNKLNLDQDKVRQAEIAQESAQQVQQPQQFQPPQQQPQYNPQQPQQPQQQVPQGYFPPPADNQQQQHQPAQQGGSLERLILGKVPTAPNQPFMQAPYPAPAMMQGQMYQQPYQQQGYYQQPIQQSPTWGLAPQTPNPQGYGQQMYGQGYVAPAQSGAIPQWLQRQEAERRMRANGINPMSYQGGQQQNAKPYGKVSG